MKNLAKKFVLITASLMLLGVVNNVMAGNRTRTTASMKSGGYLTFGGSSTLDTIVVSDTLNYVTYIETTKLLSPFIQLDNVKVGAGTATVNVTAWQSLDGVNYSQCVKGKLQTAWSKSLTLSATGKNYINFYTDSVYYTGRYLKIRLVTSNTASVKQYFTYKLKINEK